MASIRSSDYVTICGGGDGVGGGSQSSRQLARGPPPGGKEVEDNDSTPVAVHVDDGNGGVVEVNGECEGDGNSDGPADNNNNDDYNVNNNNNDDNGGGRTEAQTWDNCGEARGDGGRGGEGVGGCVCDILEQEE